MKDFKQDTQVNHLIPVSKQSAAITTTSLNFNNKECEVKNHTVIQGPDGTTLDVKQASGTIVTDRIDGKEVIKDESHSYNVVIPHMTQETKDNFVTNEKWAAKKFADVERKITDFFTPPGEEKHETPLDMETEKAVNQKKNGHQQKEEHNKKQDAKQTQDARASKSEPAISGSSDQEVQDSEISDKEAYAQGKAASITGKVPDYVNGWPEELQGQFYLGMGEGKADKWVGLGIGALTSIEVLPQIF